jgi:hypothetical protein
MSTTKTVLRDSLIREFGCLDDPNLSDTGTTEYVVGLNSISPLHNTNDGRKKKFEIAVINMRMTLIDGVPSMIHGIELCFFSHDKAYHNTGIEVF